MHHGLSQSLLTCPVLPFCHLHRELFVSLWHHRPLSIKHSYASGWTGNNYSSTRIFHKTYTHTELQPKYNQKPIEELIQRNMKFIITIAFLVMLVSALPMNTATSIHSSELDNPEPACFMKPYEPIAENGSQKPRSKVKHHVSEQREINTGVSL